MLSVHRMLNQPDFSRDILSTCSSSAITTQHRSPMLDIASLLCNNEDNDNHLDVVSSSTTTPSLSTVSSPLSTSSSVSFSSSFANNSPTTDHHMPFPLTAPSTRSPSPLPLAQQPSYHRINLTKKHTHCTKHTCYAPSVSCPSKQQHANTAPYHYQHRLLLMVDDDRNTHRKWQPSEGAKHVDDDTTDEDEEDEANDKRIKTKRRRANNKQLQVLNRVFQHTFFPSTQMRVQLGRQLGMNPRTVQIWFQNRRQAIRTKERQRWSI